MDRTKRTTISCDRCQKRKVKCQDPIPGPCRACGRAGHACKVSRETRARPFYQVSQEQFDLMLELLKDYEPDLKLDLQSLRARKNERRNPSRRSPRLSKCVECARRMPTPPDETGEQAESFPVDLLELDESESQHSSLKIDISPEMDALDGECVSVLIDTSGSHKYVGPRGEAGFNLAVASCLTAERTGGNKFLLEPVTSSQSNTREPQSITSLPVTPGLTSLEKNHLPSRSAICSCTQRFFAQIQCSLWLLPEDQFYACIEKSYSAEESLKPSWSCFLYAFLSLTAPSDNSDPSNFPLTSSEYYNLSLALLPLVLHHPDLDGVRGVLTLCLALQRHRTLTPAYQFVGIAVRLSQNLGLHLDGTYASRDNLEVQHMRRLWWSVYELERDICIKYGVPSAIADSHCSTSLPSENLLSPGIGIPIGYLQFSCDLDRLIGTVHSTMFVASAGSCPRRANEKENVDSLLAELTRWKECLPQYLQFDSPSPPAHRRAISLLHLRYWITRMFISRRFLLYRLQHATDIPTAKLPFFDTMASCCVGAAEQVVVILKALADASLLSDLSFFDTNCLLAVSLIFALSYHFRKRISDARNFRSCIGLFDLLKHIEWPAECVARLRRIARPAGLVPDGEQQCPDQASQNTQGPGFELAEQRMDGPASELYPQSEAVDLSLMSNAVRDELSPLEANVFMWDALGAWELPDLGAELQWDGMSAS